MDEFDRFEAEVRELRADLTAALGLAPLEPPPGDQAEATGDLVRRMLRRAAASGNPALRWGARAAVETVRGGRTRAPAVSRPAPLAPDDLVARLRQRAPVTVVIPVFNAPAELERCLRSVVEHTNVPHELLVIDDASTDPRVGPLLDRVERLPHARVVRQPVNRGYTATVNAAIRMTGEDLVLLNSDTEVPPGWLQGLILAVYQDERVATATPLSDNAGAFSAPLAEEVNDLPAGVARDQVGRLVSQASARLYPPIPTGSGYCMYVRRAALEWVGELDEQAFPRGYGEENDFCMRALAAGWHHVLDDATYVLHQRSASFGTGPERDALRKAGRRMVDTLHPSYTKRVRAFMRDEQVREARVRVGTAFASGAAPRPRALFVLHEGTGGTPATNLDLMTALEDTYDCYALTAGERTLELRRVVGGTLVHDERWTLQRPWRVVDAGRRDYQDAVAEILTTHAFELVHIRHLMGHGLELPGICKAFGIPVVLSFHDFYLSCPTVHLLDEQDRFCGGRCTPGPGACRLSTRRMKEVPPLKHAWVHEWRRRVGRMLADVDGFVTTSQSAKLVMERSYPALRQRRIAVIPHGRDFARTTQAARAPEPGAPIRIVCSGNLGIHKGAELIRRLAELDAAPQRLEFHFLGRTSPELYEVGVHHGPYEREEYADRVAAIAPAFAAVLSIWAETYCHTLTEAWAAGVPVLASDIGTLRERVLEHGGGWLIDHRDPAAAYRQILAAASDPAAYAARRDAAEQVPQRGRAEMAADYAELYASLLRPRAWAAP